MTKPFSVEIGYPLLPEGMVVKSAVEEKEALGAMLRLQALSNEYAKVLSYVDNISNTETTAEE